MAVDAIAIQSPRREACCLPRRIKKADLAQAASVSATAKALADPIRAEILDLLRTADGEVCQCDLQPLFDVSQPTLSHHLKKLRDGGLIAVERRGKWAYYTINDEALEALRTWLS